MNKAKTFVFSVFGTGSSNGGSLSANLSGAGNLEMGRYEVSDFPYRLNNLY